VLYVEALSGPLDRLVGEVDRLQVGAASTARLLGIATVPPDRQPGEALPAGPQLVGEDLRFAYREGHDVLHGVDFRPRVGERLAIVGPSGSGKSTLGRLLAGINGPRTGSVRVGGVDLVSPAAGAPARRGRAGHPGAPRLRRDGPRQHRARTRGLRRRGGVGGADAVGSADWVRRLPDGLDTQVGSGNLALTPAQAQQVAMARLVIADPHTLVLDEATSLIDPRTARTLEGSVHALLDGSHGDRDRAPPAHRPRRRPDRGGHRRPDRGARHPRRAGRPGRRVRRPLAAWTS
jgi:ABC-type protease/lipase transport system fused ATPase/permease subunit